MVRVRRRADPRHVTGRWPGAGVAGGPPDLRSSLQRVRSPATRGRPGPQHLLVAQFALSVTLLVAAALLASGASAASRPSTTVRSATARRRHARPSARRYPDQPAQERFYAEVLDPARALPGVESATLPAAAPGRALTFGFSSKGEPASNSSGREEPVSLCRGLTGLFRGAEAATSSRGASLLRRIAAIRRPWSSSIAVSRIVTGRARRRRPPPQLRWSGRPVVRDRRRRGRQPGQGPGSPGLAGDLLCRSSTARATGSGCRGRHSRSGHARVDPASLAPPFTRRSGTSTRTCHCCRFTPSRGFTRRARPAAGSRCSSPAGSRVWRSSSVCSGSMGRQLLGRRAGSARSASGSRWAPVRARF